jgi:hypothetical protein
MTRLVFNPYTAYSDVGGTKLICTISDEMKKNQKVLSSLQQVGHWTLKKGLRGRGEGGSQLQLKRNRDNCYNFGSLQSQESKLKHRYVGRIGSVVYLVFKIYKVYKYKLSSTVFSNYNILSYIIIH